jgi:hypothetical protein
MNFLKRLRREECGQGLTELLLVVVLVALVLWLAIKNTGIGNILTSGRPKFLTALPYYFLAPPYSGVHWLVDVHNQGTSRGERGHPNVKERFRPGPLE